nr:hypothetical protein [Pandoravirus massiliensis]
MFVREKHCLDGVLRVCLVHAFFGSLWLFGLAFFFFFPRTAALTRKRRPAVCERIVSAETWRMFVSVSWLGQVGGALLPCASTRRHLETRHGTITTFGLFFWTDTNLIVHFEKSISIFCGFYQRPKQTKIKRGGRDGAGRSIFSYHSANSESMTEATPSSISLSTGFTWWIVARVSAPTCTGKDSVTVRGAQAAPPGKACALPWTVHSD